jgi:glycosyltransferase involved in cell wall biosynthesis
VKPGETGLLVPPQEDLAEALFQLCQNQEDRRRMGAAARRRAEQQDWESIFDGLERRYLGLV